MLDLKKLMLILLLAAAVLSVPHIVRVKYFSNHLIGTAPYYHAQAAELLPERIDPLTGKINEVNAYHYVLFGLGSRMGILTASNLLPFICGLLAALFYWLILERLGFEDKATALALCIISPLFMYAFTASGPFAIIVVLDLAGFYFFVRGSYWSGLFFSLVPLFGFIHAAVAAILLFTYTFYNPSLRRLWAILPLMAVSSIIFMDFSALPVRETGNLLELNLASLGATLGFNVFLLILSMIGMAFLWSQKKKASYFMVLIMILASWLVDSQYKILLNILLSAFAAVGLKRIFSMKWELDLIRKLTIAIVIIGIGFSSLTYLSRLSFTEPDAATLEVMYWIGDNARLNTRVLSSPENGYWIRYLAERDSVLDQRSGSSEIGQALEIFRTRNETKAMQYLDSHNITYILVDEKTRELMTDSNRLGLPFIMENSPAFNMLISFKDNSLWEYRKI